jgi:beta-galactosidase
MHRSDKEEWGGWWNNHQGAGDQWYDEFYKDANNFTYLQPLKTSLVEFGEMEGCAVADNHTLMVHQIKNRLFGGNGKTYDLKDHEEIIAGYEKFIDRWGFRKAFPTAEQIFKSAGKKCYESWQQYMENVRICDAVDFAVISGWESTAIENHSGIVDNLRNHKGDPDLIASSLRPVRAVAKQHKLCYAVGESAVFDLYLLNDTTKPVAGKLHFSMVEPDGKLIQLGAWDVPAFVADQFSYTVQAAFPTPALKKEGVYKFRFVCDADPAGRFTRDIWVANTQLKFAKTITVGVSGVVASVRKQLAGLANVQVKEFVAGERYDVIIASGVVKGSKLDRQIGDETGLEAQPAKGAPPEQPQASGDIPADVLAAVKAGTPLLAMVPDDFLADGVAKQLAALGAFKYDGQVGDLRAPWMGNWLFVREHATFKALPVNRVLGIHYQARGKQSNGLLVEKAAGAEDLEVIMGYSRDHDRKVGAASFLCKVGKTPVLVHRAPDMSQPLQLRWLANSIAHVTGIKLG